MVLQLSDVPGLEVFCFTGRLGMNWSVTDISLKLVSRFSVRICLAEAEFTACGLWHVCLEMCLLNNSNFAIFLTFQDYKYLPVIFCVYLLLFLIFFSLSVFVSCVQDIGIKCGFHGHC